MIFLYLGIILFVLAVVVFLTVRKDVFRHEWEYSFYGFIGVLASVLFGLVSLMLVLVWIGYKMGAKV